MTRAWGIWGEAVKDGVGVKQRCLHAASLSLLHASQIDVVTGEKYYQAVAFKDGKMVPGEWKRCAATCRCVAALQAAASRMQLVGLQAMCTCTAWQHAQLCPVSGNGMQCMCSAQW